MVTYDLAVVGAGLGGLAAAALISSRGEKVVVYSAEASLEASLGVHAREGFVFSPGPAISYGLEKDGSIHRILRDLGFTDQEPARFRGYQVVLPDRRIIVSAHMEETLEELGREFPCEIASISAFYRELKLMKTRLEKSRVSAYLAKSATGRRIIEKYGFSREFLSFLDIPSLYFFGLTSAELPLSLLVELGTAPPFPFYGGNRKLGERFAGILRQHGGEIRYNVPAPEIVVRHGRARGIKTSEGVIEAATVLISAAEAQKPVWHLGIRDEVVPVGMGRDVLCLPDYEQPGDFFALSLSPKDDHASAPPETRALVVTSYNRNILLDHQTLLNKLSRVIPFLQDFIVFIDEPRPYTSAVRPAEVQFKPFSVNDRDPILLKASKNNLFLIREQRDNPYMMMRAVRDLVKKFG